MSFAIHIDERNPGSGLTSGYFALRGWCLDENSHPASELVVRFNGRVWPVSRQWRPDLAEIFPEVEDAGWAGFLLEVWLPLGRHRIEVLAHESGGKERVIYRDRVVSTGMVKNPWSRVWDCANKARLSPVVAPVAVDVVGVFYQRPENVDSWFAALAEAKEQIPGLRLFLVEHGPEPVLEDSVSEWSESFEIAYTHNPENPGFGAGCNAGAAIGDAPYVFLLNPDAIPRPGVLEKLIQIAESTKEEGFVGWEMAQGPWEHPKLYHPLTGETEWSSAAAWLLDRAAFERVGGFDEGIFLYGEDVDLSWRLRADGGRLYYAAGNPVEHDSYGDTGPTVAKPAQLTGEIRANAYLRGKARGRVRGRLGMPLAVKDENLSFQKGLSLSHSGRSDGLAKCSRFHGLLYEVERLGCSQVPLNCGQVEGTVCLRVRRREGGFSEACWMILLERFVGPTIHLEWWEPAAEEAVAADEWIFDAESDWLLFPDAIEQLLLFAASHGHAAVRGMGKMVEGTLRDDRWEMEAFSDPLPPCDEGGEFCPGVLRRGEAGSSVLVPKAFWLQASAVV